MLGVCEPLKCAHIHSQIAPPAGSNLIDFSVVFMVVMHLDRDFVLAE